MKHRPPFFDIVCFGCQTILARENPDGSWQVKILAEVDGQRQIVNEWREQFVCWNCQARGFVNAFDLMVPQGHGRVRIPTRPAM